MESNGNAEAAGAAIGILCVFWAIGLAIAVLMIIATWKVFAKASRPGWAAIIPIYNIIVLLDVAGKPIWWIILFLLAPIPIAGPIIVFVVSLLVNLALAQNFGKSAGFGVGLWLLPIIFMPILGFGDAQYSGAPKPTAAGVPSTPEPPAEPPAQA